MVDAETGKGLAGIIVYAVPGNESAATPTRTATDAEGAFTLWGFDAGRYMILPFHRAYASPLLIALARSSRKGAIRFKVEPHMLWQHAEDMGLVADFGSEPEVHEGRRIEMRPGTKIKGRVLDADGEGVAYAPVVIDMPRMARRFCHDWENGGSKRPGWEITRSGRTGAFEAACFPTAPASVSLGATGFGRIGLWSDRLDLAKPHLNLSLPLERSASLGGIVVYPDGTPAARARIRLAWRRGRLSWDESRHHNRRYFNTDEKGRFEAVELPPGQVSVVADADTGAPGRGTLVARALKPGERRLDLRIELGDQGTLAGTLRSTDGRPLQGVWIRAVSEGAKAPSTGSDKTDAQGRFRINVASERSYRFWVGDGTRHDAPSIARGVKPPQHSLELEAPEPTSTQLRIRAVDPSGNPIPHFKAGAGGRTQYVGAWRRAEDAVVAVKVEGAPPYIVLVEEARDALGVPLPYSPGSAVVDRSGDHDLVVMMHDRPTATGRILDAKGLPIPDTRLLLDPRGHAIDVPVGKDGNFTISTTGLTDRAIRTAMIHTPPGYGSGDLFMYSKVGRFIDVRLRKGPLSISGGLTWEDGSPAEIAYFPVTVRFQSTREPEALTVRHTYTGVDGRFELYALPSDAVMRVIVQKSVATAEGLVLLEEEIAVDAGRTDVAIRVKPLKPNLARGRVHGPGFDLESEPHQGRVCILPWFGQPRGHLAYHAPQRGDNRLWIARVPAGQHRVVLLEQHGAPRLAAVRDNVKAGDEALVLSAPERVGSLTGQIERRDSQPFQSVDVRVWHEDETRFQFEAKGQLDGSFKIDRLDATKRYTVQVVASTKTQRLVALVEHATPGSPPTLQLAPTARLAGRIAGTLDPKRGLALVLLQGTRSYFTDLDPRIPPSCSKISTRVHAS